MLNTIENRRNIIERYLDTRKASILEIGALDSPTYRSGEYNVKYLDYTSSEQLAKRGARNPRYALDKIVHVDYVSPTPEYSSHISDKFDLVIANHVIEHIPDTIRWFTEIYNILENNGILFLSVPDKRYTFDIARRNTDFIDLLRCYKEEIKKPDFYQILSHFYYHKNVRAKDVWAETLDKNTLEMRYEINDALELAATRAQAAYIDVHCHVYTSESFRELIDNLSALGMLKFDVIDITDTEYSRNEFHVVLKKQLSASGAR